MMQPKTTNNSKGLVDSLTLIKHNDLNLASDATDFKPPTAKWWEGTHREELPINASFLVLFL